MTPQFSLRFLLTMGFPFVLLAITPTKLPVGLTEYELDGSGTDTEDDDIYSGSGSGDDIRLSYYDEQHTTYHTLPSTVPNNLHSSSRVTMAKTTSEMTTSEMGTSEMTTSEMTTAQYVHIIPVHHDLPVVNTTTEAAVTRPVSATIISKDTDIPIVPKDKTVHSQPRAFGPKHDFTEGTSASPNVHTTFPDHAVTITNDESLAVSGVVAENEMMTIAIEKSIDEDLEMGDNDTDIYLIETVESKTSVNQNQIPDLRTSDEIPEETYSASGSFLERKELLAATVAAGFVGLVLAVLLVVVVVYRMKKKDEGSYTLDESKQPNVAYQKPQSQEEFYA
ncbi:syndecan-1-like isoform X2 [Scyliorhinus canicula]|uniref:syndecan-1-like isoform X2 n=1 Tax=Scyliorhinus canicula TaxID=7830 RepID=UPI0018F5C4C3|nr:syndecan-1-like isoform X2 [Scyliorhinus canicula]